VFVICRKKISVVLGCGSEARIFRQGRSWNQKRSARTAACSLSCVSLETLLNYSLGDYTQSMFVIQRVRSCSSIYREVRAAFLQYLLYNLFDKIGGAPCLASLIMMRNSVRLRQIRKTLSGLTKRAESLLSHQHRWCNRFANPMRIILKLED